MLRSVFIELVLEVIDFDWSRRWQRLRGRLLLIVVLLLPPGVITTGLTWYAEQKRDEIVRQWRDHGLLPSPGITPAVDASPIPPGRR